MVNVNWVYSLRKEELAAYAAEFGLNGNGTVEEIRKNMVDFIRNTDPGSDMEKRLEQLQEKHMKSKLEVRQVVDQPTTSTKMITAETEQQEKAPTNREVESYSGGTAVTGTGEKNAYWTAVEHVRKWSFKYDGSKDPIAFLERVEELAEMYEINMDLLPRTMPDLLKDLALTWFRNNNKRWSSWENFRKDFLEFFLPSGYYVKLEDKIRTRKQHSGEMFKAYMLCLQELMRQAGYKNDKSLERLYENLCPEYKMYIKRRDFGNLQELLVLACDFEDLQKEVTKFHTACQTPTLRPRTHIQIIENGNSLTDTAVQTNAIQGNVSKTDVINPRTACRRCGRDGHGYRFCKNAPRLFCWDCGRPDVRSLDCCRGKAENTTGLHQ